jgi:hypothetical protein
MNGIYEDKDVPVEVEKAESEPEVNDLCVSTVSKESAGKNHSATVPELRSKYWTDLT